jgi:YVTN family beta-propeller protein
MRRHAIGRCAAIMAVALALSIPAEAQTQVYVLDEGTVPSSCSGRPCYGPTVHLINTVTGHDLGSILAAPLGQRGTSMRLSSDGAVLFVTSNSFTDASAQGRLSIVDALTKAVLAQVTVGVGAADVAVLPDNSRAYVVNTTGNSVSVVDLSSFTVVATVTVQSAPTRIAVSPDGNAVYVTNRGSGTVSKITTSNNSVAANIAVGVSPRGLDISPDGSRLFVANADSSTVSVIDANSDSVLRAVPAGSADAPPLDVAAQSATRVYVTLSDVAGSASAVVLLNAADGAVIGSASILPGARLARNSSGTPAYVVESVFGEPSALKRVADDGTAVTFIAAGNWIAGAVVTDPCAFEATATATVFGPSGGTGTLTIPAPAGCSWTIDPSGFSGLSLAAPVSGTGPGTRTFTVPSSSIARLGTVGIRRQAITVEQTIPRMNVELASGGAVRQEPFTITGWALDENAFTDGTAIPHPGVDQVHVWAYPAGGAAPILVGLATYGVNRPDIAALFGAKYQPSGFSISVGNLPSGTYTLAFFARSNRSNTFSNVQTVTVTVQQRGVQIAIDRPAAGVVQTSSGTFVVAGWAVDTSATTGPGVDVVHVWAYPSSGAAPMFLGQATYGGARPDVAAYFGSSFTNCGYGLTASLAPGDYTLVVFARSVATKQFGSQTVRITVQ